MATYYAAPDGSSTNAGTLGSPWNLRTAIANASQTSGDSLYLRGGTYYGKFTSTLIGGTVCSYPGEWAVIDGNVPLTLTNSVDASTRNFTVSSTANLVVGSSFLIDTEAVQVSVIYSGTTILVNRAWSGTTAVSHTGSTPAYLIGAQLTVSGSNTVYRDFESTNSYTRRDSTGLSWTELLVYVRGNGFVNQGSGNSFINLILHDNNSGGFSGNSSSNTLIYGCLIYNNGTIHASIEPRGTGVYLENSAGYSRLYDTLVLNNFADNAKLSSVTGPYVGGDVRGVVSAGAGAPSNFPALAMNYGPEAQQSPTANLSDSVFHQTSNGVTLLYLGYGAGIGSATVTNNYFLQGATSIEVLNVANLTFTGNKFYTTGPDGNRYGFAPASGYNWNNNTYYNVTTEARFGVRNVSGRKDYAEWKALTGYDSNSTLTSAAMPDTIIVRPNAYESGRANVTIYAPSAPSSINIDLSLSGLANGQTYTLRNAFNYFGTAITTGTYNSNSPTITVSLSGAATSVATPTGMETTPSTTVNFYQMIVDAGESPQDSNGNGVVNYTYRWNGGLTVD